MMKTFLFIVMSLYCMEAMPILAREAAEQAVFQALSKINEQELLVSGETWTLAVDKQKGALDLSIPLPPLPQRAGMNPDINLIYTGPYGQHFGGLGSSWMMNTPSIEMNFDRGSAERGLVFLDNKEMSLKKDDFRFGLTWQGHRLALLGRAPSFVDSRMTYNSSVKIYEYQTEASELSFRILRFDGPFTISFNKILLTESSAVEAITLPRGFVVRWDDGKLQAYSGDIKGEAEGIEVKGSSLPHITNWPLRLEINSNREAIVYEYQKAEAYNASYLKSVIFAGGASRYDFELLRVANSSLNYHAGFDRRSAFVYGQIQASFLGKVTQNWCLVYHGTPSNGVSSSPYLTTSDCEIYKPEVRFADTLHGDIQRLPLLEGIYQTGRYQLTNSLHASHSSRAGDFSDIRTDSDFFASVLSTTTDVPQAIHLSYSAIDFDQVRTTRKLAKPSHKFDGLQGFLTDTELADIDGDGIQDLIRSRPGTPPYSTIQWGTSDPQKPYTDEVQNFVLTKDNRTVFPVFKDDMLTSNLAFRFADMNGDGHLDIVEVDGTGKLIIYAAEGGGKYRPGIIMNQAAAPTDFVPADRFRSGSALFIDVNADGLEDILQLIPASSGSGGTWHVFLNQTARYREGSSPELPTFRLSSPSKHRMAESYLGSQNFSLMNDSRRRILDFNGDGLSDYLEFVINTANGEYGICLYEHQGNLLGSQVNTGSSLLLFGKPKEDAVFSPCKEGRYLRVPDLAYKENPAGMWLLDVNNDSILDLVNVKDGRELRIWFGRPMSDSFSPPRSFYLPTESSVIVDTNEKQNSRVLDIDADGSLEIVVFNSINLDKASNAVILDFNQDGDNELLAPGNLVRLDASLGGTYQIEYTMTSHENAREKGHSHDSAALTNKVIPLVKRLTRTVADLNRSSKIGVQLYHYRSALKDRSFGSFLGYEHVSILSGERGILSTEQESQNSPVPDTITVESYESDRLLASYLKEARIFSKAPTAELSPLDENSLLLGQDSLIKVPISRSLARADFLNDETSKNLHWSQTYTRKLFPIPCGISSTLCPVHPGYFIQLEKLVERTYTNEPGSTLLSYAETVNQWHEFDAVNLPGSETIANKALAGPLVEGSATQGPLHIPEKTIKIENSYDNSRISLASLGVLTAKDTEVLSINGEEFTRSRRFYNNSNALLSRIETEITVDTSALDLKEEIRSLIAANARTRILEYTYDSFGNIQEIRANRASDSNGPDNHDDLTLQRSVKAEYDDASSTLLTSVENARGHRFEFCYREICGPGNAPAPIPGSAPGQLTHVRNPWGVWTLLAYDQKNRLARRLEVGSKSETIYQYREAIGNLPAMRLVAERRFPESASTEDVESLFFTKIELMRKDGLPLGTVMADEKGGSRLTGSTVYASSGQPLRFFGDSRLKSSLMEIFQNPASLFQEIMTSNVTELGYDVLGRQVRSSSSRGVQKDTIYKPWGKVFQDSSNRAGSLPKRSSWAQIERDGRIFGRIDELSNIHVFNRQRNDELLDISLPGLKESQRALYNSDGQIVFTSIPGIGSYVWNYDASGNTVQVSVFDKNENPSHKIVRKYDELNRLISTDVNGKADSVWTYDAYPNEIAVEDGEISAPTGKITQVQSFSQHRLMETNEYFFYNQRGDRVRRLTAYKPMGSAVESRFEERYKLGLDGTLLGVTDSNGTETNWSIAPSGAITAVKVRWPWSQKDQIIVESIDYNDWGEPVEIKYNDAVQTTYQYEPKTRDLLGIRTISRVNGKLKVLQDQTFKVGADGLLEAIIDNGIDSDYGSPNRSASFTYNDRDELINSKRFAQDYEYRYNPARRMTFNSESSSEVWDFTNISEKDGFFSPLPVQQGKSLYHLDLSGRLDEGPGYKNATYDAHGRVISINSSNGETLYFGYDYSGRLSYRIRQFNDSQQYSYYPSALTLVEKGQIQSRIMIGQKPVAHANILNRLSDKVYLELQDITGSTEWLVHASGQPVAQFFYGPYGKPEARARAEWHQHVEKNADVIPVTSFNKLYRNLIYEESLSLYQDNGQLYDPLLGRYLNEDRMQVENPEECVRESSRCSPFGFPGNNPFSLK